jgi:two-component system phosphate regulon sensor histidine kinase PhoR
MTSKQQSYRLLQDFVANVSHALRTPLAVFHGYLEILLDQPKIPQKKLKEILQQMIEQSNRMSFLVRDLLLLSRLESVLPDINQYKPVLVSHLLQSICEDAQALSGKQKHEIILDLDENLTLLGKEEELHSAFSNLIFNAVNYTPAKGKIFVRWGLEKNMPTMMVKDTGIGIAKKHLPRITQRFYRVDQSRLHRGEHGTGLGLAIVKHVLLRHHGKLLIESKINKGSIFRCVFDL